jgi:hypothetical protein
MFQILLRNLNLIKSQFRTISQLSISAISNSYNNNNNNNNNIIIIIIILIIGLIFIMLWPTRPSTKNCSRNSGEFIRTMVD